MVSCLSRIVFHERRNKAKNTSIVGGKITNLKVCVAAKAKLSRYKVLDVEPEAFVRVSAEVEQALRAKNPA